MKIEKRPKALKRKVRTPGQNDRKIAMSKNFWRNLITCLDRVGLTEADLLDLGIERPVLNRWRRTPPTYLWAETQAVLRKALKIDNANDLFKAEVPPLAGTSGLKPSVAASAVDSEMHRKLDVLLSSPRRDVVCEFLNSLVRDWQSK